MIVQIQATSVLLTANEIRNAVGEDKIAELKTTDNAPLLSAYSIVQEGMSNPKDLNRPDELKPIEWPRQVVKAASLVIKKGLQFFINHGKKTNSHSDRKSVGQVVGTITKEIAGKLNQIVIGYFPDKEKAKNMDICSIEANVQVNPVNNMKDIANKIINITGIALGSSEKEKPAFPGAVKLASLQCFAQDSDGKSEETKNTLGKGDTQMTYEDFLKADINFFKRAMIDKQFFPNQMFSERDLQDDNVIGPIFKENATLKTQLVDFEAKLKTSTEKSSKLERDNIVGNSKDALSKLLPTGLTDRQKSYIQGEFNPENMEDLSEEGIKTFIESSKESFKRVAKVFGDETSGASGTGDETEETGETGDSGNTKITDDDILDSIIGEDEE